MGMISEFDKMKSFIETVNYEEKKVNGINPVKGTYPFVTISRQAGAGGHTLAKFLLNDLSLKSGKIYKGWQFCDQEICKLVSETPGLKVCVQELIASEYHSNLQDMLEELIIGDSPQDKILKQMFQIIYKLASFGKVIIVGRGASFLTRKLPLGIHVRLVASMETRVQRMMGLLEIPKKKAAALIEEQDKARKKLIKKFFGEDIENPLLYDVVWNTDEVSMEDISEAILVLLQRKINTLKFS